MSIKISCKCGATAIVGDEFIGKIGKCGRCNAKFIVGSTGTVAVSSDDESGSPKIAQTNDTSLSTPQSAQSPGSLPDAPADAKPDDDSVNATTAQENGPETENLEHPGMNPPTWYVMTGVSDKTLTEDQAKILLESGKVRVRGPLTERQMETHYKTGMLKSTTVIKNSTQDVWKPLKNHVDLVSKLDVRQPFIKHALSVFHFLINKSVVFARENPKRTIALVCIVFILALSPRIYFKIVNPKRQPDQYVINVATLHDGNLDKGAILGKGFFIKPEGLVVTCLHIIARSHALQVEDFEGKMHKIERVVYVNDTSDLAVLKVSSETPCPPGLTLADLSEVSRWEPAFALGRGKVVEEEEIEEILDVDPLTEREPKLIKVAASPYKWKDGAPVLNKKGRVIGVATTGPLGRYSPSPPIGTKGDNKQQYKGKIAIPVILPKKADMLKGLEYLFIPQNENWKVYQQVQAPIYLSSNPRSTPYNPNSYEKSSYEQSSIANCGNGLKRVWVKRETGTDMTNVINPLIRDAYSRTGSTGSSSSIYLYEVNCMTHKKRYNITIDGQNSKYHFVDSWSPLEPNLENEICTGTSTE